MKVCGKGGGGSGGIIYNVVILVVTVTGLWRKGYRLDLNLNHLL